MHRCFVSTSWIDAWLKDPVAILPPDAAHRLADIVRARPHEQVAVFDGSGRQVSGQLARAASLGQYILAHATFLQARPASPQVIFAQAASEEAKIIETLRRGCEFGVDKFIIFAAHKSASFCLGKLKKRLNRLESVLVDAARQSERLMVPSLGFADGLQAFMGPCGVFGDPNSQALLSTTLREKFDPKADFLIVIGPEGGLSQSEMDFLKAAKLHGVRWGPYTQRTELAGLAAVSIFNAFCGRA